MKIAFPPDIPSAARAAAVAVPVAVLDRAGDRAVAVTPSGRVLVARGAGADTALVALQWLRELGERLPLPVNTPR
jgi:hypothetical protein